MYTCVHVYIPALIHWVVYVQTYVDGRLSQGLFCLGLVVFTSQALTPQLCGASWCRPPVGKHSLIHYSSVTARKSESMYRSRHIYEQIYSYLHKLGRTDVAYCS